MSLLRRHGRSRNADHFFSIFRLFVTYQGIDTLLLAVRPHSLVKPQGTDWEGGVFKVMLKFSEECPSKPPKCKFVPPLFHLNVYSSGTICLSIFNKEEGWHPAITVKQMLMGIQDLLDMPNPNSPAQSEAYNLYMNNKAEYQRRVKAEAQKNTPNN